HIWGFGSSPIIYRDFVILNFGPGLNAFVIALDKCTGNEVWRREFPGQKSEKIDTYHGSWSTPVLHRESNRDVLLLALPHTLWAVDPTTGKDVWFCGGLGDLVYTSPFIHGDVVVAVSCYGGPLFGVRRGGSCHASKARRLMNT